MSDVWDVAVMGHSDFPSLRDGIPGKASRTSAFDGLLGKPAIVVIQNATFAEISCRELVEFVERLNLLNLPADGAAWAK